MLIYIGFVKNNMSIKIRKLINYLHDREPEKFGKFRYELECTDNNGKKHEISIIKIWCSFEVLIADHDVVRIDLSFEEAMNLAINYLSMLDGDNKNVGY